MWLFCAPIPCLVPKVQTLLSKFTHDVFRIGCLVLKLFYPPYWNKTLANIHRTHYLMQSVESTRSITFQSELDGIGGGLESFGTCPCLYYRRWNLWKPALRYNPCVFCAVVGNAWTVIIGFHLGYLEAPRDIVQAATILQRQITTKSCFDSRRVISVSTHFWQFWSHHTALSREVQLEIRMQCEGIKSTPWIWSRNTTTTSMSKTTTEPLERPVSACIFYWITFTFKYSTNLLSVKMLLAWNIELNQ